MARVLVADDDAGVREALATAFRVEGLDVEVAGDGTAAIAAARREPPDVIVLDVHMPTLDGWSVATRLLTSPRTAHVPIVFVTERTCDAELLRGRTLGAAAYVTKPFDVADLCALVHDLVDRHAAEQFGATG